MHVDASAMVAMLVGEADRLELLDRLERAANRSTSVVSVLETIMAISRETGDRAAAPARVRRFLDAAKVGIEPVAEDSIDLLAEAFVRYGKGSGHPAKLNLGDCFSYAMAKKAGMPLLYKGNDFAQTDMA
jgi:ribonuclease VapC